MVLVIIGAAIMLRCSSKACCAKLAKWITCCYDDPILPTHMQGQIQHPLPIPQAPPIYNSNASGHPSMIKWKGHVT